MEIQLLLPNRKPIPVTAELTETGLMIYSDERKISMALRGELWRLYERPDPRTWQVIESEPSAAPRPEPVEGQPPSPNNWDWLTPQFVIDYFERSDVLRPHAADVRAALKPLLDEQPNQPDDQQLAADVARLRPIRAELIDEEGQPRHGAKTRVALELGGKPAGSFYYTRVLPAIEALSSSSTAPERTESGDFERSAA